MNDGKEPAAAFQRAVTPTSLLTNPISHNTEAARLKR